MSTKEPPEPSKITLDKERYLGFSIILSQLRFQRSRGRNMAAALKPLFMFAFKSDRDTNDPLLVVELLGEVDLEDIACAVWSSLGRKDEKGIWRPDEDLTIDEVAGLLDPKTLMKIWGIITKSLGSTDDPAEDEKKPDRPTQQETAIPTEPIS